MLSPETRCFSISVNEYVRHKQNFVLLLCTPLTYSIRDYLFVFLCLCMALSRSLFRLILFGCCHCNGKQANAMIVVTATTSNIIMMEDNDIAELTRKITVIISL